MSRLTSSVKSDGCKIKNVLDKNEIKKLENFTSRLNHPFPSVFFVLDLGFIKDGAFCTAGSYR